MRMPAGGRGQAERGPVVTDLPEAERDALQAVQALAALNGHLARSAGEPDERRLRDLTDSGGAAAGRVLAYLRALRGAGDGESLAHPSRLGPWRDWCPPRGDIWARRQQPPRQLGRSGVHRPGRGDPGE
jgi:hypothetical protein